VHLKFYENGKLADGLDRVTEYIRVSRACAVRSVEHACCAAISAPFFCEPVSEVIKFC
jgi:hypothetical protein